jgi:hypothetical protein
MLGSGDHVSGDHGSGDHGSDSESWISSAGVRRSSSRARVDSRDAHPDDHSADDHIANVESGMRCASNDGLSDVHIWEIGCSVSQNCVDIERLSSDISDVWLSDVRIWDIRSPDSLTCVESDVSDTVDRRFLVDEAGGHTSDVEGVGSNISDVGLSYVPTWDIGCSDSRTCAESDAPDPEDARTLGNGTGGGHASDTESLYSDTSDVGLSDVPIWDIGCSIVGPVPVLMPLTQVIPDLLRLNQTTVCGVACQMSSLRGAWWVTWVRWHPGGALWVRRYPGCVRWVRWHPGSVGC